MLLQDMAQHDQLRERLFRCAWLARVFCGGALSVSVCLHDGAVHRRGKAARISSCRKGASGVVVSNRVARAGAQATLTLPWRWVRASSQSQLPRVLLPHHAAGGRGRLQPARRHDQALVHAHPQAAARGVPPGRQDHPRESAPGTCWRAPCQASPAPNATRPINPCPWPRANGVPSASIRARVLRLCCACRRSATRARATRSRARCSPCWSSSRGTRTTRGSTSRPPPSAPSLTRALPHPRLPLPATTPRPHRSRKFVSANGKSARVGLLMSGRLMQRARVGPTCAQDPRAQAHDGGAQAYPRVAQGGALGAARLGARLVPLVHGGHRAEPHLLRQGARVHVRAAALQQHARRDGKLQRCGRGQRAAPSRQQHRPEQAPPDCGMPSVGALPVRATGAAQVSVVLRRPDVIAGVLDREDGGEGAAAAADDDDPLAPPEHLREHVEEASACECVLGGGGPRCLRGGG